jgi:hypothetical protein
LRIAAAFDLEYANVMVTNGGFLSLPFGLERADPKVNVIVPGTVAQPVAGDVGVSVALDDRVAFSVPSSEPAGNVTESPFGKLSVPPEAPGMVPETRLLGGGGAGVVLLGPQPQTARTQSDSISPRSLIGSVLRESSSPAWRELQRASRRGLTGLAQRVLPGGLGEDGPAWTLAHLHEGL